MMKKTYNSLQCYFCHLHIIYIIPLYNRITLYLNDIYNILMNFYKSYLELFYYF